MNTFPPKTERQMLADRLGSPAYSLISSANPIGTNVPKAHFNSLVCPAKEKAFATQPKHLGQTPPVLRKSS